MDYTRTYAEILVGLINQKNPGRNFTTDQLDFQAPVVLDEQTPKAVSISVSAVAGSGYTGERELLLRRLDITDAVPADTVIDYIDQQTIQDVVAAINDQFELNLVEDEDYDGGSLADIDDPYEGITVTIPIRSQSFLVTGTITVKLARSTLDLDDAIEEPDLGELSYP